MVLRQAFDHLQHFSFTRRMYSLYMIQEFQKELQARAVAYINVDSAVQGNFSLRANGVHSLSNMVFEAAKLVKNPDSKEVLEGRNFVYDTWFMHRPSSTVPSKPE